VAADEAAFMSRLCFLARLGSKVGKEEVSPTVVCGPIWTTDGDGSEESEEPEGSDPSESESLEELLLAPESEALSVGAGLSDCEEVVVEDDESVVLGASVFDASVGLGESAELGESVEVVDAAELDESVEVACVELGTSVELGASVALVESTELDVASPVAVV